jgi:hypothetical protein
MPRLRFSALVILAGLCLTDGTALAQKGYRPPPPPPRPISIPPPANNNRRPANDNRRVNTGTGRTPGASGGQAGQRLPRPRPQSTVRKPAPSSSNMPRMAGVNSARMGTPRLSQPVIAKPTVAQQALVRNRLAAVRAKLATADFRARLLQRKKAQDLAAMQRQKLANDQRATKTDRPLATKKNTLLAELKKNGVKHNPDAIIRIDRDPKGLVVFLEQGDERSGLSHILAAHGADFERRGIPRDQIPDAVIAAVTKGKIVGSQGRTPGRPIYEVDFNGKRQRIAVSTGDNGYIVGANPAE